MAKTYLIDANILLYTLDRREPLKQRRAAGVLDELRVSRAAALSTQTLGEFYSVSVRKLPHDAGIVSRQLQVLVRSFDVYPVTLPIVLEAARASAEREMSYWDAQVWATAKLNAIPYVLSEDLQGWQTLEGVTFANPLLEGFDLASLTK